MTGNSGGQNLSRLVSCVLIAATFTIYWQVVGYDFFDLDDSLYVISNIYIKCGFIPESIKSVFSSTQAAMWLPLTWLSFILDFNLYGLNPAGYHLTNIIFHVINVLLLFLALRTMSGAFWKSAIVAALFALHPLHIESVAWITERKDVLSGFFWMLCIIFYSSFIRNGGLIRYTALFACFLLGLMAKPMVVTLPIILLLLDYWPFNRIEESWTPDNRQKLLRVIGEKIPLFILSLVIVVVTLTAASNKAIPSISVLSIPVRISNALVSYMEYIYKAFVPINLASYYPHPGATIPLISIFTAFIFLGLTTIAAFLLRKRFPYLIVGWLWYLLTLFPVIGIFQAGMQAMADRFVYIPLIGIYCMVVWGVGDIISHFRIRLRFVIALTGTILIVLSTLTYQPLGFWKDTETLYNRALDVTKNNYIIHTFLGHYYMTDAENDKALDQYAQALLIAPGFVDAIVGKGKILIVKGDIDKSIALYEQYIKSYPNAEKILIELGNAYLQKKEYEKAIGQFRRAIKINPGNEQGYLSLGNALTFQEKQDDAVDLYQTTLAAHPRLASLHVALGQLIEKKGYISDALLEYDKAIAINPFYELAYLARGLAVKKAEGEDGMIVYFQRILDKYKGFERIHNYLGVIMYRKGDMENGLSHLRAALRINPKYIKAHVNIGSVFEHMGKMDDALWHYSEALRLLPKNNDIDMGGVIVSAGGIESAMKNIDNLLGIETDLIDHEKYLEKLRDDLKKMCGSAGRQ